MASLGDYENALRVCVRSGREYGDARPKPENEYRPFVSYAVAYELAAGLDIFRIEILLRTENSTTLNK